MKNNTTMWTKEKLLTTFSIRKLYKEYNTKYFKGKLGDCNFDVYTQGKNDFFSYAYSNAHKKRNGGYTANINFNAICEWDEKSIRDTLLHEMIHYYHFILFGRVLIFPHGIPFIISQLRFLFRYGIYVPMRDECKVKIKKGEQ